ncbi:hypothetical protein ABQJ53_06275 [Morganella morganii]
MTIIGFVLLLVMHGSAVPVTDDIYTLEECESRAVQVMAVRNVELVCAEVVRENTRQVNQ